MRTSWPIPLGPLKRHTNPGPPIGAPRKEHTPAPAKCSAPPPPPPSHTPPPPPTPPPPGAPGPNDSRPPDPPRLRPRNALLHHMTGTGVHHHEPIGRRVRQGHPSAGPPDGLPPLLVRTPHIQQPRHRSRIRHGYAQ